MMPWYRKKEIEGAQMTQSRLHFNSGRGWYKRDYSDQEYLTEHRSTQRPSYEIRTYDWNSLGKAAWRQGLRPRMIVVFAPAPGIERWVEVTGPYYIRRGGRVYPDGRVNVQGMIARVIHEQ